MSELEEGMEMIDVNLHFDEVGEEKEYEKKICKILEAKSVEITKITEEGVYINVKGNPTTIAKNRMLLRCTGYKLMWPEDYEDQKLDC